jgi:hypothetical protein
VVLCSGSVMVTERYGKQTCSTARLLGRAQRSSLSCASLLLEDRAVNRRNQRSSAPLEQSPVDRRTQAIDVRGETGQSTPFLPKQSAAQEGPCRANVSSMRQPGRLVQTLGSQRK